MKEMAKAAESSTREIRSVAKGNQQHSKGTAKVVASSPTSAASPNATPKASAAPAAAPPISSSRRARSPDHERAATRTPTAERAQRP
jgi:hypothetical protein